MGELDSRMGELRSLIQTYEFEGAFEKVLKLSEAQDRVIALRYLANYWISFRQPLLLYVEELERGSLTSNDIPIALLQSFEGEANDRIRSLAHPPTEPIHLYEFSGFYWLSLGWSGERRGWRSIDELRTALFELYEDGVLEQIDAAYFMCGAGIEKRRILDFLDSTGWELDTTDPDQKKLARNLNIDFSVDQVSLGSISCPACGGEAELISIGGETEHTVCSECSYSEVDF